MIVWVTRDEPENGPLSESLRREGLRPILEPVVRRRTIDDAHDALRQLGANDWLVLTSAFAVECLAQDAARVPRVAAIGETTASAARDRGMRVECVARTAEVVTLFAELLPLLGSRPVTVCYPRSSLAAPPPPLPDNVRVLSPVVYGTEPIHFDREVVARVECMAVTSASAVHAIGPVELLAASIGPATTAALRALGMEPWVIAPQPNFAALARAIADQARSSRHHRA